MSYLLDALRKSELERRIGEVPSLNADFSVQSTAKKRYHWVFLIVALVIINLGIFLYLTVVDRGRLNMGKENPLQSSPRQSTTKSSEKKPLPQPIHKFPTKTEPSAESLSGSDSAVSVKTPSVTEQAKPLLSAKTQGAGLVPPVTPPPTITEKRTTKAVVKQVPIAKMSQQLNTQASTKKKPPKKKTVLDLSQKPVQSKQVRKPSVHHKKPKTGGFEKPMLVKPATAPRPTVTNTTPSIAKTNAIPLLAGMPRDFQREFPTLNINVFVYSEDPKERFVIIDMVKYVSGQKIDSGVEILDIRQDSVVLNYRGRKLRVKRP